MLSSISLKKSPICHFFKFLIRNAIGYIMSRSGLEVIFEIVYASGTVPLMISGYAYSIAFRGKFLARLVVLSV